MNTVQILPLTRIRECRLRNGVHWIIPACSQVGIGWFLECSALCEAFCITEMIAARHISEPWIFRRIEEILPGFVLVSGRNWPMWLGFVTFVKCKFKLHTARIIDEKLPEGRFGDNVLAPIQLRAS
jgi:hypothetical protein